MVESLGDTGSELYSEGWRQGGSRDTVWPQMWTHAWDYMWGLGAGTGEEPTSCLSYITNFLFPVIFLTMCLFPASFSRNFPCAHNLCCLVSVSRRLSRITFAHQGEGIWTSAICDTYIFFKLSTEILFSFIITWKRKNL